MAEKNQVMQHNAEVTEKLGRLVSSAAYQYQRRRMIEMLAIPDTPVTLLDVGCGEGSLERDLRQKMALGSEIVGLDTSAFVIDMARRKEVGQGQPIEYMIGDALNLSFAENTLDIVICSSMLKYLQTPENEKKALQEQMRVTRPGGQMLVVDSNDYSITYRGIDPVLERKMVNAYALMQGDPESGSRIESLCKSISLEILRMEKIVLTETEFSPEMAGQAMAQNMCSVLEKDGKISVEESQGFYSQLESSAQRGEYGWSFTKYAVLARKPETAVVE
jgi:ubiquinone/menaquinone biosynthesis C-methylase UbiE